jgi:hypothetical protein
VKVSILRGGGLAGITTRTEVASAELPADAARTLEQHAEAVAPAPPPRERHPDEMLYTVRVEHDGESREAHYTDSTLPDEVRSLISWADKRPERREDIVRG